MFLLASRSPTGGVFGRGVVLRRGVAGPHPGSDRGARVRRGRESSLVRAGRIRIWKPALEPSADVQRRRVQLRDPEKAEEAERVSGVRRGACDLARDRPRRRYQMKVTILVYCSSLLLKWKYNFFFTHQVLTEDASLIKFVTLLHNKI